VEYSKEKDEMKVKANFLITAKILDKKRSFEIPENAFDLI
jgi:hypothetical protein